MLQTRLQDTRQIRPNTLNIFLIALLVINTLVLGRSLNLFRLPGERDELAAAREGAMAMVSYVERTAREQGLHSLTTVQDLIARLQYDVQRARSTDELAQVMMVGGSLAKEVLDMEQDAKRREVLQSLVNSDPGIAGLRDRITITVSNEQGRGVVIVDETGILSEETVHAIRFHQLMQSKFDAIAVEVNEGKARVLNYRTLYDRIKVLQQEVQSLQAELRRVNTSAGYASLTGSGVRVELFDAVGGFTNDFIVHDADVRDLVNELLSGGAAGVSIGGQRLTATTSIRCAGAVILVNQRPIAVNPVVIEAVGDPDILASSLDLIANTMRITKGIRINVEKKSQITLPAAPGRTP